MKCHIKPIVFITAFAALFNFNSALAQSPPKLAFPVECTLGKDCWTVNYVDTDSAEDSHKDFMCGAKTYEAHKGTDFSLRSRIEMEEGVNVLAAADGQILRVRDGESDSIKSEEEFQAIQGANRDCGNGVIINHGNGLLTYYCHLKKGSIKLKPKQDVKEGDVIAQIGQSGFSEFPHLHFTVIWEGGHIDPFTGVLMGEGCRARKEPLWKNPPAYSPYALFDAGFENQIPDFNTIKAGRVHPETLSISSDAFVYWVGFYHARKGDELSMKILGAQNEVVAQKTITIEENRKRPSFRYIGRKLKSKSLQPGTYKGITVYKREGFEPQTYTHSIEVE